MTINIVTQKCMPLFCRNRLYLRCSTTCKNVTVNTTRSLSRVGLPLYCNMQGVEPDVRAYEALLRLPGSATKRS